MKNILFCAESVYQLFNCITLRMTVCEDAACDLILSTVTSWEEDMLERLEGKGVFGRIVRPQTRDAEWGFWDLDDAAKMQVLENPALFFIREDMPIEPIYDEIFVPIDHIYWKMLYHYQTVNDKPTKVFMYDEGVRAYTMDIPQTDNRAIYKTGKYSKALFVDAIEAYYLYQPELYSVKNYKYELRKIPNPKEYVELKEILVDVYGYEDMPSEEYIYLEDFFFADRFNTNDFELFEQVVELVGKDNIIVKRHPRDYYDRFTPCGYKTVERSVVPWEIQLLANGLRDKVLISVSSTSLLTPYIIFESDMHVVSLERMFVGENRTHADAGFSIFFDKLKKKINEKEALFHTPASVDELIHVLKYIKMENSEC